MRHVGRLPFGKAIVALMEWSPYVMDTGGFRAAFAIGKPDRREMFLGGDGAELRWRDGRGEPVDSVILGTGYRPVGPAPAPVRHIHRTTRARVRRATGQRALYTMALGGAGWAACYVARRLRRELESRQLRCCARH